MTVPMQYFCCGILLLVFGVGFVDVSVTVYLMYVQIVLVRSRLLSGHPFGKDTRSVDIHVCSLCIMSNCNLLPVLRA